MRIGELAAESGVAATTIRYYESVGLLPRPARSAGGYRAYGQADLNRLLLIKRLRLLGVGLAQLRGIVDFASAHACTPVRERLLPLVDRQLVDLERQLAELALLREDLLRYRDTLQAGLGEAGAAGEAFCACDPATCACLGQNRA